jgi:DNA-binding response OmpR family regulator
MARVLVIDDEELVAQMLQTILENGGHSVLVASRAREGLRLLDSEAIDLVLTDLQLSDLTGVDIVAALREHNAELPIIVLSGAYDGPHVEAAALRLGATRFMGKPVRRNELLDAVSDCLAGAPPGHSA